MPPLLKIIKEWFTPPFFPDDEDKTLTARVLYALILNMLAVLALSIMASIFVFTGKTGASILIFVIFVWTLVSRALAQRGHVRFASAWFVTGTWLIFTLALLLTGRMTTVMGSLHIALTVITGTLLGRRSALIIAVLSSIVGLGLAVLENAGYPLPHYFPAPPLSSWAVWILAFLWTLTPLNVSIRGAARALARERESEKRFRLLAENSTDMISRHTPEGVYLYASPACEKLLGYPPDELVGHAAFEFIHPDDIPKVDQSRSSILEQQFISTTVYRIIRKDGQAVWLETTSHTITDPQTGEITEIHAATRDITERIEAEEALKISEEKFAKSFRSSPDIIVLTSLADGKFIEVNERIQEITGYTRTEIIGKTVHDLQLWSGPTQRAQHIERLLRDGYVHDRYAKFRIKSGEMLDTLISSEIIELQDEKYILGTIRNITEQKQAQNALRISEERYRLLAENAPDIIFRYALSPEARLEYINPAVEKTTGYTPEECYADPQLMLNMAHPDDAHLMAELMQSLGPLSKPIIMRWVGKDGVIRWMESRLTPVYDEAGQIIAVEGLTRDISGRKQAEEERIESEQRFSQLFQNLNTNFMVHEIIVDETGQPSDYRFLEMNPAAEQALGMTTAEVVGKTALELFPKTESYWIEKFGEVALTGNPTQYENYSKELDKYYDMRIYSPQKGQFALLGIDITERKQAEEKLTEQLDELRRWHQATLGRESRILDLKREVNELLKQADQSPRYLSAEE